MNKKSQRIPAAGNFAPLSGSLLLLTMGSTSLAIAAGADVAITLTASPDPVVVNGELTYSFEVRNQGEKAAKKLIVNDILPANTRFVSASPGCKARKYGSTGKVSCKLKKLQPGLSSSWTIVVMPTAEGTLSNTVTVSTSSRDPNPADNSSSVTTAALLTLNQQPVASSVSLAADGSTRTIVQQLIATDADNDTLTYELLAPVNGTGYTQASINPQTGVLTLTLLEGFSGTLVLPFRVTDGKAFSNTAEVTIVVTVATVTPRRYGLNDTDPNFYANLRTSRLSGDLLGAPGGQPSEPPSVDLTASFPTPGDQGSQGSCVGWATAYALKSYQEGREIGWSLDTPSHLFSPAYVYNQINHGVDKGSNIDVAFQLMIDQGAASLATMPYNDSDYLSQPSTAARTEAAQFKALSFSKADDTNAIKAALVNRQPVSLGIYTCDSFQAINGNNPVYNTLSNDLERDCGKHAVTVIGYDNNRFGGAFKIINSWGTGWGSGGYFWLPYSVVTPAVIYGFVLEDKENTINPSPPPPPPPPPNGLPNLVPQNWSATYDPNPGGSGSLQWRVINSGTNTAPAGAYVNLMLSTNDIISANDLYVVYEQIPDITLPGHVWYRDAGNPISFTFPSNLLPGVYYMALWVDDLDTVAESNEDDNVSFGSSQVAISGALPDLSISNWEANWSNSTGLGTLQYEILNGGGIDATAGWDVNLVLSRNQVIGDGDEYYLFYETIPYTLPGGYIQFRHSDNPGYFNLFVSQEGNAVPSGIWYMAVWVDDRNLVREADETNNTSLGGNTVQIGAGSAAFAPTPYRLKSLQSDRGAVVDPNSGSGGTARTYNGKELPSGKVLAMRKVKISETPEGGRKLEVLEPPQPQPKEQHRFSKGAHARNQVIFPVVEAKPMAP